MLFSFFGNQDVTVVTKFFIHLVMPDSPVQPPKLLDQIRTTIRLRGMSYRTEQTYADWVKRYIIFHQKRRTTCHSFSVPRSPLEQRRQRSH